MTIFPLKLCTVLFFLQLLIWGGSAYSVVRPCRTILQPSSSWDLWKENLWELENFQKIASFISETKPSSKNFLLYHYRSLGFSSTQPVSIEDEWIGTYGIGPIRLVKSELLDRLIAMRPPGIMPIFKGGKGQYFFVDDVHSQGIFPFSINTDAFLSEAQIAQLVEIRRVLSAFGMAQRGAVRINPRDKSVWVNPFITDASLKNYGALKIDESSILVPIVIKKKKYQYVGQYSSSTANAVYEIEDLSGSKMRYILKYATTPSNQDALNNEIAVMKKRKDTLFVDSYVRPNISLMLMNKVPGKNLHELWESGEISPVPEDMPLVQDLARKIIAEVKKLHRDGFVHMDLASRQIIVELHQRQIRKVTLIDYADTQEMGHRMHVQSLAGEATQVPEIKGAQEITVSSSFDWYTLGLQFEHFMQKSSDPQKLLDAFPEFKTILEALLEKDPRKRQQLIDSINQR